MSAGDPSCSIHGQLPCECAQPFPTFEEVTQFAEFCSGGYLDTTQVPVEWLNGPGRERMRAALLAHLKGYVQIHTEADVDNALEVVAKECDDTYAALWPCATPGTCAHVHRHLAQAIKSVGASIREKKGKLSRPEPRPLPIGERREVVDAVKVLLRRCFRGLSHVPPVLDDGVSPDEMRSAMNELRDET